MTINNHSDKSKMHPSQGTTRTFQKSETIADFQTQTSAAVGQLYDSVTALEAVKNLLKDGSADGVPNCSQWELAALLELITKQMWLSLEMVEQIGKKPN